MDSDVEVIFEPGPPARFVATYGDTTVHAWTEDEVVRALARALWSRPGDLPETTLQTQADLVRWIRRSYSRALLAGDL